MEDRTLRRSCPLARNYFPAGLWDWIYVEAVRYIEMVPLARNSMVGTSFRCGCEGWSNWRVDLNQAINWTLQVDSTIRIESPFRIDSTLRIDSTPRI